MEKKVIDQKEYLRKYLSSGNGDVKKKKKKKVKVGPQTVKIIDDDIDLKNMRPLDENEIDIFIDAEEAPQIAGIVDERGPVDFTDRRRWKIISNNQDGDLTVTRHDGSTRKSKAVDSDVSPPRKHTRCSDDDLSPPRMSKSLKKQKNKTSARREDDKDSDDGSDTETDDSSHKRKKKKRKMQASDSDLSPCRQKKNYDSDLSPPRKHKHKDSHTNLYKEKRDHKYSDKNSKTDRRYDSDMSPPRRRSRHLDRSRSRSREDARDFYKSKRNKRSDKYEYDSKYHSHKENSHKKQKFMRDSSDNKRIHSRHRSDKEDNEKRMKKTLDGKKAGLQDARALREETEAYKKREAEHFSKLSKDVTGVDQAAVVRDTKTGKRRDLEAEAAAEREKQKRQAELDEKYLKWGKGLKQVEDREEKLKDDFYEMSKPLARYRDDADLDKRLRDQEREGDPMLEYIKQKQIKEGKRKPDQPAYKGSFMPNRFGIKPGHRWDGVDRSNGYEKRWFEAQNAKVARQEEAYKWSTSDM